MLQGSTGLRGNSHQANTSIHNFPVQTRQIVRAQATLGPSGENSNINRVLTPPPSSTPVQPVRQVANPASTSTSSSLVTPQRRLIIPGAAAVDTLQTPQQETVVHTSHTSWTPSNTPQFISGQRVHSLHAKGLDVIKSMSGWAETELQRYLKSVERSWQPSDLLPDPASPDFYDQVQELRKASAQLPSDYLVVLVGDMVTEEALPSYMNMLNTLDGTKDETGGQDQPWAYWTRHWTAEENRHGDLLNKYLYLSGRVDMRSIEITIQNLIGSGLDPKLENNPYLCFVYTSFQERATKISHGNTARLASYHGDTALTKICGLIAADEGRHEAAYSLIVEEFFKRDPEGALLAFADMMKKGIVMPAHFMDDNAHETNNKGGDLFQDYASVADNIGVYTTTDYANIVDHLVKRWRVAELSGLSGEAAEAQEYLIGHAARIRRLAHIQAERKLRDRKRGRTREASFSWINGRQVSLN